MAGVDINNCVHHFIVDPEADGRAAGRCKTCGQLRMFRTDSDDALPWYKTTETLIPRRRRVEA